MPLAVSRVNLKTRATRVISSRTTTMKTNQRERPSIRNVKDLRLAGRMPCGVIWCPPPRSLWGSHHRRTYNLYPFRTLSVADASDSRKWTPKDLKMALRICFLSNAAIMCAIGPKPRTLSVFAENVVLDTYTRMCELLPVHKELADNVWCQQQDGRKEKWPCW